MLRCVIILQKVGLPQGNFSKIKNALKWAFEAYAVFEVDRLFWKKQLKKEE
jgi:hypothetical protein